MVEEKHCNWQGTASSSDDSRELQLLPRNSDCGFFEFFFSIYMSAIGSHMIATISLLAISAAYQKKLESDSSSKVKGAEAIGFITCGHRLTVEGTCLLNVDGVLFFSISIIQCVLNYLLVLGSFFLLLESTVLIRRRFLVYTF